MAVPFSRWGTPALGALVPMPMSSTLDLAGEDLAPALEAKLLALEPVLQAVHATRPYILAAFAVFAAALLFAALLAGVRGRIRRPRVWRFALLAALAFPAASTLMLAIVPRPTTSQAVVFGLLAAWALIVAASAVVASAGGPRRAVAALLLGTAALLLVDQWLGGPWSFTGVLGYSPLDGVRFYGLGNEGAAVLFASALIGGGIAIDGCPPGARKLLLGWLCLPLLGAVVVLTSAAPSLGANVTVAIWGTLGFATATLLASGQRIRWTHVLAALGIAFILLAGLSLYDLSRPDGGTHLARILRQIAEDGAGAVVPLLARKAAMNARMMTSTPASLLVPLAMGWLAYALAKPGEKLRPMLAPRPAFVAAMWGTLVGSAIAFITEDSGVVIPAVVLLFAAGSLAYVTTLVIPEAAVQREPGDSTGSVSAAGVGE